MTTTPGFNMCGVSFVGLESETITLNELLSGEFVTGDEVQVYTPGAGYSFYTYKEDGGWRYGRASADTKPLNAGDAIWLKTPGRSVAVTFKGGVQPGNFRHESIEGYQMVAPSFPIAFPLNATNGECSWEGFQEGDEIQMRDGAGYIIYKYNAATNKWRKGRAPTEDTIPVGASVWMKTANPKAVLTIVNPIGK